MTSTSPLVAVTARFEFSTYSRRSRVTFSTKTWSTRCQPPFSGKKKPYCLIRIIPIGGGHSLLQVSRRMSWLQRTQRDHCYTSTLRQGSCFTESMTNSTSYWQPITSQTALSSWQEERTERWECMTSRQGSSRRPWREVDLESPATQIVSSALSMSKRIPISLCLEGGTGTWRYGMWEKELRSVPS